jgi:hypothetical protein
MNATFQENFSGIKVIQLFQRERENSRRFGKINEEHYLANMQQISVFALFVPLIEVLSSAAVGLVLWYGGGKVIQEAISLGVLVAFLSYIRMFFQPIRDLSEKNARPCNPRCFSGKDLLASGSKRKGHPLLCHLGEKRFTEVLSSEIVLYDERKVPDGRFLFVNPGKP